jgi:hypothetical protein
MKRMPARAVLLTCVLGLSACSSKTPPPAGFLPDYSVLSQHPTPSGGTALTWVDPKLPRGRYIQGTLAEPALPRARADRTHPTAHAGQHHRLLRRGTAQRAGQGHDLVERPGPNTLVIRPVISRVDAHTQGLRFYEWLPITLVAAGVAALQAGETWTVKLPASCVSKQAPAAG